MSAPRNSSTDGPAALQNNRQCGSILWKCMSHSIIFCLFTKEKCVGNSDVVIGMFKLTVEHKNACRDTIHTASKIA